MLNSPFFQRAFLLTLALAMGLPSAALCQRGSAFASGTASRPRNALTLPDSLERRAPHRTGTRVAAGFGMGVAVGVGGLFTGVCVHNSCSWDFVYGGIAGYWVGGILGTSMVTSRRCGFGKRFGRAFVGALPGTAVSYGVARASYMNRDLAAVASTAVVAAAPLISSAVFLRGCD
jgi:hypothetical protein